eukprot:TRINITY_DN109700_c0_g1_i1.p1 TRINITY_DN109700_c0_g1~~TRINITY_DN109700_c0_g1_i1.p1  ORF type:complete len:465 (+),score=61.58 TRINITY_DN109700_c0_g1_i1:103-1497(+)
MPGSLGKVSIACLTIVGVLEGADMILLSSVLYALQRDLGLTLQNLAVVSMCQAIAFAAFGPMWGILADRNVASKQFLLVAGCTLQGLITAALASVDSLRLMLVLRLLNGVALSSLKPLSRSIVAESVPASERGFVISILESGVGLGCVLGALCGTQLASRVVLGMQGWRFIFILIGSLGVLAGLSALFVLKAPAEMAPLHPTAAKTLAEEWKRLCGYLKINSFVIIVAQGCFGAMPWAALAYLHLFFRTAGLSNNEASLLFFAFLSSKMIGTLIGGVVGDKLEALYPGHGRPLTAQISVLGGIPFALLLFLAPVMVGSYFGQELLLVVCLGLISTWCGAGVNAPVLCELVDENSYTTILAWEYALEGAFANFFGNLSVGLLGQFLFGYRLPEDTGADVSTSNKEALGNALAVSCTAPWVLCFVFYSLLHQVYPADQRAAKEGSMPRPPASTYGAVQDKHAQSIK